MLQPRAKSWLAFLGIAGVIALAASYFSPSTVQEEDIVVPSRQAAPTVAASRADVPAGSIRSLALPPRQQAPEGTAGGRDIFETRSWYVAPPPPPPAPVLAPPPPPPPQAPPLPFNFMGWMDDGDRLRAFLARGDKVYTVGTGEELDSSYRVEKLEPTHITFLYLPLSQTQTLSLGGGLPTAASVMPATSAAESAIVPQPAGPAAPPTASPMVPTGTLPNEAETAPATARTGADDPGAAAPNEVSPASAARRIRQQDLIDRGRGRALRR